VLLTARKNKKESTIATPKVIKRTGVHWEKTLNPWTTFILLETPAIKRPAANVKLNRKAVSIYLKTLFVSAKSLLLITNPIIKSKTPTPIEIHDAKWWFKFQVRFLYPSVKNGILLFVDKVPPNIPASNIITTASKERTFLLPT